MHATPPVPVPAGSTSTAGPSNVGPSNTVGPSSEPGGLADVLAGIERGEMPPADGALRVVPQPSAQQAAVVAFTAHTVVVADVEPGWVHAQLPADDLSAPLGPPFLSALAARLGRRVGSLDIAAFAPKAAGEPQLDLAEVTDVDHPRVRRAHRYRAGVRVWTVEGGVLILGRGLAGRWEAAFEVDPSHRGRGLGRLLARSARQLLPADARGVWAQVAPGNAASVRAVLAAGYQPVGSEVLLVVGQGSG